MKYMLLIYSPEDAWTPDEWKQCVETSMGICQEMAAKGQFLAASPLHPVATATCLRVRNGQRFVTAGPVSPGFQLPQKAVGLLPEPTTSDHCRVFSDQELSESFST